MSGGYFDTAYGNWLPEDRSDKPVAHCAGCYNALYAGEDAVVLDGDCFCDMDCLAHHIGAMSTILEDDLL